MKKSKEEVRSLLEAAAQTEQSELASRLLEPAELDEVSGGTHEQNNGSFTQTGGNYVQGGGVTFTQASGNYYQTAPGYHMGGQQN